jgi:hypothetical protein
VSFISDRIDALWQIPDDFSISQVNAGGIRKQSLLFYNFDHHVHHPKPTYSKQVAMATQPWPQYLVQSFTSVNQPQFSTDENAYYGPYARLLYYLFGLEGPFEISPQYLIPESPRNSTDVVALFTVELNKHPVFFILVKPPASHALDSKRKQADDQMRDRFRDLRRSLVTPRLPAISAFGTRLSFYEYTVATNTVVPAAIPAHPVILNDLAPADRWSCDLLDADGIARLRQIAQDVRAMCQALAIGL